MFQIDLLSRTPVYEQIVEQTEEFVLKGILKPGDQLPSVRSLSMQLSLNPNTIQKAYGELDQRGVTLSVLGRGCFIREDVEEMIRRYREKRREQVLLLLQELKQSGLSRPEAQALLDQVFKEGSL